MPRTRAELKAELEAEAAQLIEELLAWSDVADAPTLTEIEDQVLKLRQQFGEKLARAAVERRAEARRRNWTQAQRTVAIGDGAPWVWNLVGEHYYRQPPGGGLVSRHHPSAPSRQRPQGRRQPLGATVVQGSRNDRV